MSGPLVLVVDDERRYRELIELNLARRGYRVLLAADGLAGLNLLERESPDLIVLDLMLPDMDGYEVCRRIREYSLVPIIMLTAKSDEFDKVRGLHLGADDYVTKPFGAEELLARVEAVLRRAQHAAEMVVPAPFVSAGLTIDFAQRRVALHGRDVDLSPGEYKLLHHLAVNAGRMLVHEDLLRRVWGPGYEGDADLLHAAIRRLRRKLAAAGDTPSRVHTRRGVGYWLEIPTES